MYRVRLMYSTCTPHVNQREKKPYPRINWRNCQASHPHTVPSASSWRMESIALGCAAARSDGGGGSDKHSAAGDRTPMANGDSDGSQVRTADGYKIPSAAAPAAAVALDVWWIDEMGNCD
ncbi:hypothetical protein SORBI_3009G049000 [Sorghum bicolor]|uniref:Uncharacterized protein n=1 Tax=Sorghum bicolor TaxID=4558 RepID=A0A1B6P6W3_SORBI|nr:hypothetical protein SORBI_3009G049000 [Sorghum bicolor]OQU77441.1 hypothetical protein SORBI_3009G049000 [Sorghum bicolor]OQU77443.1 hypothetical protein SORBI_3009G049000 [Sorghum bicolor]OQU77444.1 hypothetical protein SORBI_3009G049000 [Sorghum bicolor]